MKFNYTIWITLVLLISIILISCTDKSTEDETMVSGVVDINGETVDDLPVNVGSKSARLPFLRTVKELGMVVEEKEDGVVHVINDNDIYVLNYSKDISFVKQGDTDNLMIPVPGSDSYYCKYKLNDIIIDCETLNSVLHLMGVNINIYIDYSASTVTIVTP